MDYSKLRELIDMELLYNFNESDYEYTALGPYGSIDNRMESIERRYTRDHLIELDSPMPCQYQISKAVQTDPDVSDMPPSWISVGQKLVDELHTGFRNMINRLYHSPNDHCKEESMANKTDAKTLEFLKFESEQYWQSKLLEEIVMPATSKSHSVELKKDLNSLLAKITKLKNVIPYITKIEQQVNPLDNDQETKSEKTSLGVKTETDESTVPPQEENKVSQLYHSNKHRAEYGKYESLQILKNKITAGSTSYLFHSTKTFPYNLPSLNQTFEDKAFFQYLEGKRKKRESLFTIDENRVNSHKSLPTTSKGNPSTVDGCVNSALRISNMSHDGSCSKIENNSDLTKSYAYNLPSLNQTLEEKALFKYLEGKRKRESLFSIDENRVNFPKSLPTTNKGNSSTIDGCMNSALQISNMNHGSCCKIENNSDLMKSYAYNLPSSNQTFEDKAIFQYFEGERKKRESLFTINENRAYLPNSLPTTSKGNPSTVDSCVNSALRISNMSHGSCSKIENNSDLNTQENNNASNSPKQGKSQSFVNRLKKSNISAPNFLPHGSSSMCDQMIHLEISPGTRSPK